MYPPTEVKGVGIHWFPSRGLHEFKEGSGPCDTIVKNIQKTFQGFVSKVDQGACGVVA